MNSMPSFLWALRTHDSFTMAWPLFLSLAICLVVGQTDFLLLITAWFAKVVLNRADSFRPAAKDARPTGLVVIPSLLRNKDDLNAITTTIESCATNGYPSELVILASVDGRNEQPALLAELTAWVAKQSYPENVHVHVTGTPTRLGKMMAVEAGVVFMHGLVDAGAHARFPDIYFSIDGDGTLGANALERLAARLATPHPLTGNPRRIVSGKICIRPDLFWQGWKTFFSVKGQIYIQVAREFVLSNVSRYNWKLSPAVGVPGALYCTWSELLIKAPYYMGFMQSLRFRDWLGWWVGRAPPLFSKSSPRSLPEALTGASDDTCMAFLASIATWKDGKMCFDAPRTPLHAMGRVIMGYLFERSHDYEPEARVFTYTPDSITGMWKQRVRWNASRFECAGRFWRSFGYHWEIGVPVIAQLSAVLRTVIAMTAYYVLLPYYCLGQGNALMMYVIGYATQTLAYTLYTGMALMLERDYKRFWRVVFALPLASAYCVGINFFGCVYGVTKDLLVFGNTTNFAPEWTMAKSGCERVALLYRARRFFAMSLRSVLYGDVPLGTFWFGWNATKWTASGFEGWTTGKAQRPMIPRLTLGALSSAFAASPVAAGEAPVVVAAEPAVVAPRTATALAPAVRHAPTLAPKPLSIRLDHSASRSKPSRDSQADAPPSRRAA